jgi:hypothetical protein
MSDHRQSAFLYWKYSATPMCDKTPFSQMMMQIFRPFGRCGSSLGAEEGDNTMQNEITISPSDVAWSDSNTRKWRCRLNSKLTSLQFG